ncbi:MAG: Bax inhibitor-1/YccA family protein [Oscillospiraceae bacterium]|nr:Bax inhibitor-1/YccA family protein [Oscillospiraceae bacterium]
MNTLAMETRTSPTLFHSNPVLRRLSRVTERAEISEAATYSGIASKTGFFLLMTLVGIVLQLISQAVFAGDAVWQTLTVYGKFAITLTKTEAVILTAVMVIGFVAELLGIFVRKTIPVTGSLYAVSQGFVISFLVFDVLAGYEYLGLEALLLTIAVIAVMSRLYTSGRIRDGKKYRMVMLSLFLGSLAVGLFTAVGFLIPVTRPYAMALIQNAALSVTLDVIGLVIASLFLISDFSLIQTCVEEGYPKEYEWSAAFGLVFTVIWVYLKILDLLMRFAGKSKKD